jgi:hypothetical protein
MKIALLLFLFGRFVFFFLRETYNQQAAIDLTIPKYQVRRIAVDLPLSILTIDRHGTGVYFGGDKSL